jgi:hypothetical protein
MKKKCFCDVKCGRCVGPTTLPPSMSRLCRQCGIFNISQPHRPPRSVTGIAFLLGSRIIHSHYDNREGACFSCTQTSVRSMIALTFCVNQDSIYPIAVSVSHDLECSWRSCDLVMNKQRVVDAEVLLQRPFFRVANCANVEASLC